MRRGALERGCYEEGFWHACRQHDPVVSDWLRKKVKDEYMMLPGRGGGEPLKRGRRVLAAGSLS